MEIIYSTFNHQNIILLGFSKKQSIETTKQSIVWFDSKSTNENSFQPFQKHLRIKQSIVSTKQQVVFT